MYVVYCTKAQLLNQQTLCRSIALRTRTRFHVPRTRRSGSVWLNLGQIEMEAEIALLFFPDPRADPPRPSPYVQAAFNGHVDVVEYAARRYPAHVDHTDT